MLITKSFIFTSRDVDQNIKRKDHQLLIKSSCILQEVNGIFNFLPLGTKVLENISKIIDKNMERFGFCKMTVPTLQDAENWRSSGRYDAYGKEMLRVRDRHDRELIYAPTAEESVFNVVKNYVRSYRDLPKYLYQIHWKFRDEISPRNGLLRSREFLMKDGYSFDKTEEEAKLFYLAMYNAYVDIFNELGIGSKCVFAKADSGAIGGSLNHEMIMLNEGGDCDVFYQDNSFIHNINSLEELDDKSAVIDESKKNSKKQYKFSNGTEIGHIFNYGDQYSAKEKMNAHYTNQADEQIPIYGGCYGIGVSRLVQVIVDCFKEGDNIIWPESVAPFKYHIILANPDLMKLGKELHEKIGINNCLLDDREITFGNQINDAELIGMPYHIILGNKIELRNRITKSIEVFQSIDDLLNKIWN